MVGLSRTPQLRVWSDPGIADTSGLFYGVTVRGQPRHGSILEALKINRGVPGPVGQGEAPAGEGEAGGEMDLMETIRSTVESMTGDAPEGGDSQEAQADRAISNTLGNLTGEIRRSIQFFENQSRGLSVKRLVIGGGSANFTNLDGYLQKELSLDVEVIDPLLRIPITGSGIDADQLREARNLLSVGIGLALRKVVD